jgi:hypothetical protein
LPGAANREIPSGGARAAHAPEPSIEQDSASPIVEIRFAYRLVEPVVSTTVRFAHCSTNGICREPSIDLNSASPIVEIRFAYRLA